MLHLLPLRLIVIVSTAALGAILLTANWLSDADSLSAVKFIIRISLYSYGVMCAALVAGWRWIPKVQELLFPYLGGTWTGTLNYDSDRFGKGTKSITLRIRHTLIGIRILLETDESTSSTMFVQADRETQFGECKLYYGYQSQRKDGVQGSKAAYRGLAILRFDPDITPRLFGSYFTEVGGAGDLEVTIRQMHPWWKLWC